MYQRKTHAIFIRKLQHHRGILKDCPYEVFPNPTQCIIPSIPTRTRRRTNYVYIIYIHSYSPHSHSRALVRKFARITDRSESPHPPHHPNQIRTQTRMQQGCNRTRDIIACKLPRRLFGPHISSGGCPAALRRHTCFLFYAIVSPCFPMNFPVAAANSRSL